MLKQFFGGLVALLTALCCEVRVMADNGQIMMTFPSGGPYRVTQQELDRRLGKEFAALTVTFPPNEQRGVLFLDGKKLKTGQTLSREQAGRLYLFSTSQNPTITIGVVPFPGESGAKQQKLRIRCINPSFSGNAMDRQTL